MGGEEEGRLGGNTDEKEQMREEWTEGRSTEVRRWKDGREKMEG